MDFWEEFDQLSETDKKQLGKIYRKAAKYVKNYKYHKKLNLRQGEYFCCDAIAKATVNLGFILELGSRTDLPKTLFRLLHDPYYDFDSLLGWWPNCSYPKLSKNIKNEKIMLLLLTAEFVESE